VLPIIVSNPSIISNLSPPKIPDYITLANGSKAHIIGIGQASPLPSQSLNYVLFVPSCSFNLISMSKLTRVKNRRREFFECAWVSLHSTADLIYNYDNYNGNEHICNLEGSIMLTQVLKIHW